MHARDGRIVVGAAGCRHGPAARQPRPRHLDIVVPDPAASAKFYARIFRTSLHQQPLRDTIRYFVLLGDLPADRQVGYIAIARPRRDARRPSATTARWPRSTTARA